MDSRPANQRSREDNIGEASQDNIDPIETFLHVDLQKEKGKGLKRWHRIHRRSDGPSINMTQWIVGEYRPLVNIHLVVGLEPLELHGGR